jgi:glucose-1-phosphate cytidylyltransferase
MKVVILAGGLGTRISEETSLIPKPMIEIGGKPLLWHLLTHYSYYGFNDFIILLGYKGYVIKEYFLNYYSHNSDLTVDLSDNSTKIHSTTTLPWKVTLIDSGLHTMTGGRLKRAEAYLKDAPFMVTYGDGVTDLNITKLLEFHNEHGKCATVTSVQPIGRFGVMNVNNNNSVTRFVEKPISKDTWINGGFFVFNPSIFNYLIDDAAVLEEESLEQLAKENDLMAFKHTGFWQCMDTLRDKHYLQQLWDSKQAPWAIPN